MTLQYLTCSQMALLAWFAATVVPVATVVVLGVLRIWWSSSRAGLNDNCARRKPTEVLVPVKGRTSDQETILASLLEQTHPCYKVTFIVESESDPANRVVDALCDRYAHARKIVAGFAHLCAQKNHNLIAGVRELGPETEVVVLCDSTNCADPEWLLRLTKYLETGQADVVTTFRVFNPEPQTIWGVCQAIYGATLFPALAVKPKPWGGATAIRRKILDRPKVTQAWARTIVDDLVLGNLLDEEGIKVLVAPECRLTSPLFGQTFFGFLNYLDRQLVFPKFTNPGIWLASLIVLTNASAAYVVSLILVGSSMTGLSGGFWGLAGVAFIVAVESNVILLRSMHPYGIPWWKWFACLPVLMFLATYLLIRSVFRDYLIWHGKRYRAGTGGQVLEVTLEPVSPQSAAKSESEKCEPSARVWSRPKPV